MGRVSIDTTGSCQLQSLCSDKMGNQNSSLHSAAANNDLGKVEALIAYQHANVNERDQARFYATKLGIGTVCMGLLTPQS